MSYCNVDLKIITVGREINHIAMQHLIFIKVSSQDRYVKLSINLFYIAFYYYLRYLNQPCNEESINT